MTTSTTAKGVWVPKVGGYAWYHGRLRQCRGLVLVTELTNLVHRPVSLKVKSEVQTDEFTAFPNELSQALVLIIDLDFDKQWTAYCSKCGNVVPHPRTALDCPRCHRRFFAMCDPYEGALGDMSTFRVWPLRLIPYRTMQLSQGTEVRAR